MKKEKNEQPETKSETCKQQQETENMETHKHPHHPTHKKKWGEYLLEFVMIFLAVFLGFIAENMREHFVEHQRERKYAVQLLNDLKKDTSAYGSMNVMMKEATEFYDSARIVLQQKPLPDDSFTRLARDLYFSFNLITTATTFNQMKNSGSLRYIKNINLATDLSNYYDQWVPRLLTFFEYINEKLHSQIEPFFAQHFDLNVTPSYYYYDSLPAHLRYYERTEMTDVLIKNYFQLYFNGISYIRRITIKQANEKAIGLMELLKKEYDLE